MTVNIRKFVRNDFVSTIIVAIGENRFLILVSFLSLFVAMQSYEKNYVIC